MKKAENTSASSRKRYLQGLFYIDVIVKRKLDYDPSPDGLNVKEVKRNVLIAGQGFNSGKT